MMVQNMRCFLKRSYQSKYEDWNPLFDASEEIFIFNWHSHYNDNNLN